MMFKIIYFVPESHLEQTKQAIFAAGAGGIGRYTRCAWQVLGIGQFQPEAGSQPYIGVAEQLQQVAEWRVESIVPASAIQAVVQALRESHPYEEPAFEFIQLYDITQHGSTYDQG